MKIQVETVSPVERKVTIEVDPDHVAKEVERAYSEVGKRVKLRGFRPGKAPRKVIERLYRSEVEGEVVEKIMAQTFPEALRVESIDNLVAPPQFSVAEGVSEGKPMRYTAHIQVKPKLEPKDYKGLEVVRKQEEIGEETVAAELARIRESLGVLSPVEGRVEAQEGDWAVIDHEGTIDGEPFEGSKGVSVTVRVAPGTTTDGNIGVLAGRKIGDVVELEERFAADHRTEALRGKVAHMKVTLRALRTREVPALDDALAKRLGIEGVETLDQLRARIRGDLERREARRADNKFRDDLVHAALARNEFEVPPALVERAIDAMIESAAARFAESGVDINQMGLDFARLRADVREQALTQVRGRLLLEAIAEAEKLEVSDDELKAEILRLATDMGTTPEKVQATLRGKEGREALINKIKEDKVLALLTSNAKS